MIQTLKINSSYVLAFIMLSCYFFLGFFFDRSQFYVLLISFFTLFSIGYYLITKDKTFSFNQLVYFGVLIRLLLLFSVPFLSQDFYRFIWDGRLVFEGINPYQFTPDYLLNLDHLIMPEAQFLRDKMGDLSGSHFSNYPPFNQFLFQLAGFLSYKSIFGAMLVFKLIILFADIGILHFGRKILKHFNWNENRILFYFLNPLVLLELAGNLHFEGVMIFFVVLGFYLLLKNKLWLSAICIGLSISTKLLPLLMLPFLFKFLGFKKGFYYCLLVGLVNVILFVPFLNSVLYANYTKTIALWFVNFEFNASFYYLVREIGFYSKGYNIIGTIGKIIPVVALLGLFYFSFIKKNKTFLQMVQNILFFYTFYFLISTTVHPWYIINLIFLACFTRFNYAFIWSLLIVLSYYAYSVVPFQENFYLIFIEYALLLCYIVTEFRINSLLKFNRS